MTLLIFLIVLSLLVFVHEFGHFIAARIFGVRVEEFGFGFPPRMFGIKRGETLYSVNWIPLGGFVKLKGESGDFRHEHDSFASKSVWKRAIIVSSGVLMNLLLAAIIFTGAFAYGMPQSIEDLPTGARVREERIVVGAVLAGSPAESAGFQIGDKISAVDGLTLSTIPEIQNFVSEKVGQEIVWKIERGEEVFEARASPEELAAAGKAGIGIGLVNIGIVSFPWYTAPFYGGALATELTGDVVRAFAHVIANLVREGRIAADLSGPVGIAVLTGQIAALGLISLLQFVAVLSINLAVINFVPFPALDGGRFLFLLIESLRGRPVGRRLENAIHQIGFALLLALVVLITYRDLIRFSDAILGGIRSLF